MHRRPLDRELSDRVWPLLRERGFETFAAGSAWRHWAGGVDVVSFTPVDPLEVAVYGCPAGSFFLDLGVHLDAVPDTSFPDSVDGRRAPRIAECHVTRRLPPARRRTFRGETRIWVVEDDGSNLGPVFGDAASKLRRALPGFERFHEPARALDALAREGRWHPHPAEEAWLEVTGYLAIAAGRYEIARPRLERLLAETDERRGRLRRALEMLPR